MPGSRNGANKVLTDVQRLCSNYVPAWLGSEQIAAADVAEFYADPVKLQCESESLQKALWLRGYRREPRLAGAAGAGQASWRSQRSGECVTSRRWRRPARATTEGSPRGVPQPILRA